MGQRIDPTAILPPPPTDHQPIRAGAYRTLVKTRRSTSLPPPARESIAKCSQPGSDIHSTSPTSVHSLPLDDSSPSSPSSVPGVLDPVVMPRFFGEITETVAPQTFERVSIISRSNLTLVSFSMDPNLPAKTLPQLRTHLTARVATRSGTLVVGDTHGSIYLLISAYIQAGVLQFRNQHSQINLCRLMAITTFSIEPTDISGRLIAITHLDEILSDLVRGPCFDRFVQVLLLGDNFYDRGGYDELTMLTLVVLNRFIPTYFLIGNHDKDFLVNCLGILSEEYNSILDLSCFTALPRMDTSTWHKPLLATQSEGRSGHGLDKLYEYTRRNNAELHSRLLLALSHCLSRARVFGCSENIFYSHTPVTQEILLQYAAGTLTVHPETFQEFATLANTAFATIFRPLIQFGTDLANSNINILLTAPTCFDALNTAQIFCNSEEVLMLTWKSDDRRRPLRGAERFIRNRTNAYATRTYSGLSIAHIFGHEENRGNKPVIGRTDRREVPHTFLRLSLDRQTGKPAVDPADYGSDFVDGSFCPGTRALAIDTSRFSGLDLTPRPAAAAAAR